MMPCWNTIIWQCPVENYAKVKEVTPNLGQIMQGVMAGSISDTDAELDRYSEAVEKEWESAMSEAGVEKVKFQFDDWDPVKDYNYSK